MLSIIYETVFISEYIFSPVSNNKNCLKENKTVIFFFFIIWITRYLFQNLSSIFQFILQDFIVLTFYHIKGLL